MCACAAEGLALVEEYRARIAGYLIAAEFRNQSWFDDAHASQTLDFLRERGIVHVIVDAPPDVSKRVHTVWEVTNPELALVRLHGRNVETWQDGEVFMTRAETLLDAAAAARVSVGRAQVEPQGRLRVSMSSSFGRQHVSPVISEFLRHFPGVSVDLRLTDQLVDFVDAGIDVAIRIGVLKDSTLVARRLAVNRHVLCASPAYPAERGMPHHPSDLARHECIILSDQRDWAFVTPAGAIDVRVNGRLVTDNGEVIRDALLAGFGIALKSTWDVAPYLRSGELFSVA